MVVRNNLWLNNNLIKNLQTQVHPNLSHWVIRQSAFRFVFSIMKILFLANLTWNWLVFPVSWIHFHASFRFDPPANYCSFVQSKGRGRAQNSKYLIMVANSKRQDFERDHLDEWKLTDSIVKQHCMNRSMPTEDESVDHFDDMKVPPFCPDGVANDARITLNTARGLLSR